MKFLLFLAFLATLSMPFNLESDDQACSDSYAALLQQVEDLPTRLDVTPKVYSQKLFDCVRAVPGVLDTCDLPKEHELFDYYLPKACINELQDITTLADQYDRATNNITKTLYLTQLTAKLTLTFPLKCPNLNELIKHYINKSSLAEGSPQEITPDCGEAIYQYSLLLQNVVQDFVRRNQKLADDTVKAIVGLPNMLDTCGEKTLADALRRSLPKECLQSITSFVGLVQKFVFNYSHLEWVFLHRKQLFRALRQIHYTCPAL